MSLSFKVSKEDFEKVPEEFKALYVEKDGVYQMQIKGAVDSEVHDQFRQSNTDLLKAQKGLDGIDMKKYNIMLETERKIRDKELMDKGDFDTLYAERSNAERSNFEAKIATLTGDLEKSNGTYNSLVTKVKIEDAATKAFSDHSINPKANEAVMSLIKNKFTIDNGSVVAKEDGKILSGKDGNLTIDEYVSSQTHFMAESNGGAGEGGEGHSQTGNKTAAEKIASGLSTLGQ